MRPVLTEEEEALLVDAIRAEELRTSAEIRVCVTYKLIWRHERYAWNVFDRAGMRDTRQRNGVLIVMMPTVKKVVIIGDTGINAVVPEDFWKETVAAIIRELHESNALDALREGLRRLGDTLSIHWPREGDDVNELSDEILS
ncbi:MAG: TPM domain-containing protein [Verrucomicrobiota bacterium]